ncbi:M23 family metallopeptidase [Subtercola sp. YIM 133946]|uniref:M23 family metallopeptidase n=1 Tax=Subtercola sp. YIM 133946 TaxID=3118909 RepID=UPI002F91E8DD
MTNPSAPPTARRRAPHGVPRRPSPRAPRLRLTLRAAAVSVALVLGDALTGGEASAAEYPSWDDVLSARSSEATKQGEVTRIQGLIAGLEAETMAARAVAEQRGAEYELAQIAFDAGAAQSQLLEQKAAAAATDAAQNRERAGAIAAQLSRSAGSNLSSALTGDRANADDLLYRLGALSKLTETTSQFYELAEQSRNAAATLSAQADVAEAALAVLRAEAEEALARASEAQREVEASLAEELGRRVELAAQLDVLTQNRAATEADYQAGVLERKRIADEAARAEREAREAAARAGGGGGGGSEVYFSGSGGQGWSSPLPNARVADEYGNRLHPIDRVWRLHAGIDLVSPGGTCGANVYAAAAGTVTFAGSNGGLGNAVTISHGGGRTTVYGHNTTLVVRSGWSVVEGQLIAKAGTTGASTGCHVHFETRLNGVAQNPRDVLAQYGSGF